MRKLAAWRLAFVVVAAIGCKARKLVAVEAYERAACGCRHHDLGCARAARDAYWSDRGPAPRWFERVDFDEIHKREDAAEACVDAAMRCSDTDRCDADQSCASFSTKTGSSRQYCVRIAALGETCDGPKGTSVARGSNAGATIRSLTSSATAMARPAGRLRKEPA